MEEKSNKLVNVAVIFLVTLILLEAGYFLYTRYVGPINFPWRNLSTNETRSQSIDDSNKYAEYSKARGLDNGGIAPIRQIDKAKFDSLVTSVSHVPPGMLASSVVTTAYTGVVLETDTENITRGELNLVASVHMVSSNGDKLKFLFTQDEFDALDIHLLKQDSTTQKLTFADIQTGDTLTIITTTDLLDWREGHDAIVLEIRRPRAK
jgi:hypothetical protein